MTGRPGDGTMEMNGVEVPRCTSRAPFASLCFCAFFNRARSKGAFRLPGATWDHFHCTVTPSPGHIRCRISACGFRDFQHSTPCL